VEIEKDLADIAVAYGSSRGASYVEARVVASRNENYAARNGVLLGGGISFSSGIAIRVLVNGSMGFCSTPNLTKIGVEDGVEKALKLAKVSQRKNPIRFSEEEIVQTKWKSPVKNKFEDISIEEKQNFLIDLDKILKREFQPKLPTRTLLLDLYSDQKYIVTNEGSKVESENSIISTHTFNTAKGKAGGEQRMSSLGGTGGWEWIEEKNVVNQILENNRGLVKAAQHAIEKPFSKIDVIISGEVAGIIAHENVGHPSEADRILGREGAQAGESFYLDLLQNENLGEIKIGTEQVTIIDDPTRQGNSGFYLYDDECIKARPRYLIKKGMLNELFLNREYASIFNTKSNAAARAISYKREPIIRMANTFFAPGNFTLEELFNDVKKGIYMKSFTEWNIDDRRFQSKYVGLEAYLIDNGEITETMIRRPVLESTTFGLLSSVDGVSKDFYSPHGDCGKGDPMQGAPVWLGGPHVRLKNIKLGGDLNNRL
jgi:TldD protein